ncbi:MAG: hypothetical protein HRT47_00925 [Candidatus Caenarcaniphilales bacterium]|nr:hypothetical protein [Candidatus Caenarcaniphilales bacterium]
MELNRNQSEFKLPQFTQHPTILQTQILGKIFASELLDKRLHVPGAFKPSLEEQKAIDNFLNSFEAKKLRPHLTNMVMASQALAIVSLLASQQISTDSAIHLKSIDLSHHDLELFTHAAFNVMFGSLVASRALLVIDEKIKSYIPDILGFYCGCASN